MLDIGFWELGLIVVIALLVIPPKRLPGIARHLGRWLGQVQRWFAGLKNDLTSPQSKDKRRNRTKQ